MSGINTRPIAADCISTPKSTTHAWGYRVLMPAAGFALSAGFGAPALAGTSSVPQIQHVIVIMQENRSFDSYFGTFPGANGIPNGVCVPINVKKPTQGCVAPFHDVHQFNAGGPHFNANAVSDIDDGLVTSKMDGFVQTEVKAGIKQGTPCDSLKVLTPPCYVVGQGAARHDVMGYHTDAEIPNYWLYAEHFRLSDEMFPGIRSWSMAIHMQMTSEWSASCTNPLQALTCVTDMNPKAATKASNYPWASVLQHLDVNGVSWKYYLGNGNEPDCDEADDTCAPVALNETVYSYWNPVPYYSYVKAQGKPYLAAHVTSIDQYLKDIKAGTLAQVSWVVPSADYSEHPPAGVTMGMNYTTSLVNAVMQSPYWANTVILLAWDDWGGFYDHVSPPLIRIGAGQPAYGLGLRTPEITIGAYVVPGVDHTVYSVDSFTTFIEDLFAGGARLNPTALGNPDNRPYIADSTFTASTVSGTPVPLGNLMSQFNFKQTPLPALVLSIATPGGLLAVCSTAYAVTCTSTTVNLSWDALGGTFPSAPVYHVTRDGTELPACAGTGLSCTDQPGSGAHMYRSYSVINGVSSPLSAAVEADEP
jgi:phospholipase C